MKFRYTYFGIGTLLAVFLIFATDPDGGFIHMKYFSSSSAFLLFIFLTTLYVGYHHLSMKGIFDWFDYQETYKNANRSPVGSGLNMVSSGLWAIAVSLLFIAVKM